MWRSGACWGLPPGCCSFSSPPLSSQCSVTCGKGYKQRLVSCSEIYTGKENYEYSYQSTINCPGTQPPGVQPCYLRGCPISATWRVGNWGSVSRLLTWQIGRLWDLKPPLNIACLSYPNWLSSQKTDPGEKQEVGCWEKQRVSLAGQSGLVRRACL